ncbi:class I SAM-dependent methyltransferase [Nocardia altamirensis]|uniref:class I SAM-dependent methyltransferase n=1 Tax=Nocardia altamirensis TaxID=472158 RepID=UPI00083FE64A|nr:class I SAM-dependent methyltransferase [Nocardia altamirensis]
MDDARGKSGGLFSGAAWHYARYRPGYPSTLVADIVDRFRLDRTGRLLDLGCGTGQLTVPLAAHVGAAVGVDPEIEMLVEAAIQAEAAHVANVAWVRGSSVDLPGRFGSFRLVTMGRSFHWMDREQVLSALDGMVVEDGGIVIANDSCLVRPQTPWQQVIEDIQDRFLPNVHEARPALADDGRTHEDVLARSTFRQVQRRVYEFDRCWTVAQTIGYLYSTSLPLRRLLGARQTDFEEAISEALLAIAPDGRFIEPVTMEVLTATR